MRRTTWRPCSRQRRALPRPRRHRLRGHRRLTYARSTPPPTRSPTCWSAGHRARRQGRAELPEPAVLHDRLLRDPQGRRRPSSRSTCCSRGARSPTTSATPRRRPTSASRAPPSCRSARRGTPGFQAGRGVRALLRDHRRPGGAVADRGRRDARAGASAGQPPTFETVADRRGRHRGHPLHLGHDRTAQGRRAAAPQHARQRARRRADLFGADAGRPDTVPVRAAAVPLLRPDRDPERRVAVRRHGRDAAAVRGRRGAAADAGRGGHLLRGRPDDVLGPARCAEGRTDGDSVDVEKLAAQPARRRRRRLGAAGRGAQGLQGQVRRDDPRGLRALGDLTGGQLLAGRTKSRASARSACRSPASR